MRTLEQLYRAERERLAALSQRDTPQGEYRFPVFGAGSPSASVVLFGEAPGGEETACSTPFVGKAGRQLNQLLELAGVRRGDVYISNIVKYRPVTRSINSLRNRTPGPKEIREALPLVRAELALLKADTIVTLGNTPLKAIFWLTGDAPPVIGQVHGRPAAISLEGRGYTLFPLFHPASGIYNRELVKVMEEDARLLGEHLVKQGNAVLRD